jgi:hypothetical protein
VLLLVSGWTSPRPLSTLLSRLLVPFLRAVSGSAARAVPGSSPGRVLEGSSLPKVRRAVEPGRAQVPAGSAMSADNPLEEISFLRVHDGWLEAVFVPNEYALHPDERVRAAFHFGVLKAARRRAVIEGYVL